jgi:hypothetical protein
MEDRDSKGEENEDDRFQTWEWNEEINE